MIKHPNIKLAHAKNQPKITIKHIPFFKLKCKQKLFIYFNLAYTS